MVPACAIALTLGTALGGWRIIKTVGRGIYRIDSLEGLVSQTASAGVIFGASLGGAPVSTSQVVASSVVGLGGGRRRWRHVNWEIVREMLIAWIFTLPAAALRRGCHLQSGPMARLRPRRWFLPIRLTYSGRCGRRSP